MKTYNKIEIENLIKYYFEGETSSKEEQLLQEYFLQEDIDGDFLQYRPLFNAIGNLAEQPELMGIDTSFIDNSNNTITTKASVFKKHFRIAASVIAGIAACVVLFFMTYHPLSDTFVVIDGKKYTDKAKIQTAFDASIENVRIDLEDVFSDLHDVVIEED